jgi:tripartite-type tricarboxylate transporter receptor subunit TctC
VDERCGGSGGVRSNDRVKTSPNRKTSADQLAQQGMKVVASEPEEWGAYLKSELARYAKIIKDTGIKPK